MSRRQLFITKVTRENVTWDGCQSALAEEDDTISEAEVGWHLEDILNLNRPLGEIELRKESLEYTLAPLISEYPVLQLILAFTLVLEFPEFYGNYCILRKKEHRPNFLERWDKHGGPHPLFYLPFTPDSKLLPTLHSPLNIAEIFFLILNNQLSFQIVENLHLVFYLSFFFQLRAIISPWNSPQDHVWNRPTPNQRRKLKKFLINKLLIYFFFYFYCFSIA